MLWDGIIFWLCYELVVDEIPVCQEQILQPVNCFSLHTDDGIAPLSQTIAFYITIGDIDTSNIAYFAVYYYDFPMIAVVYLAETDFRSKREKRMNKYALVFKRLFVRFRQAKSPEIVVYYTYFDPFLSLTYE